MARAERDLPLPVHRRDAAAAFADLSGQPWPAILIVVSTLLLVSLVAWLGLALRNRLRRRDAPAR